MKPFRATYRRRGDSRGVQVGPVEVLIIEILPPPSEDREAEAVFVLPNGRLAQDYLSMFHDCRIPRPEG